MDLVMGNESTVVTDALESMTSQNLTLPEDKTLLRLRDVFNGIQIIMGVAIIVTNAFIIWMFGKHDFLKSKPNIFLFSLSLADVTCGVTIAHTGIFNFLRHDPDMEFPCVMAVFLQTLSFGLSLYCMAGVACVNYIKIAHPYTYGRYEESNIHLAVAIVTWVWTAVNGGVMVYRHRWVPGKDCYLLQIANKTLNAALTIPQEVILLILITVLFGRILLIARRHRHQIASQAPLPSVSGMMSHPGDKSCVKNTDSVAGSYPGSDAIMNGGHHGDKNSHHNDVIMSVSHQGKNGADVIIGGVPAGQHTGNSQVSGDDGSRGTRLGGVGSQVSGGDGSRGTRLGGVGSKVSGGDGSRGTRLGGVGSQVSGGDGSRGTRLGGVGSQVSGGDGSRGTRLVLGLVIVMYVCWFPLLVQIIVRSVLPQKPTHLAWIGFSETANIILFSNSLWNPFLMHRLSPNMKKAFRLTFSKNRGRGDMVF